MTYLKHAILTAVVVLSSAASAAVDRNTGMPMETPKQIAERCGVELTNPNAIVEAAGAPCGTVGVLALMEPKEQAQDHE